MMDGYTATEIMDDKIQALQQELGQMKANNLALCKAVVERTIQRATLIRGLRWYAKQSYCFCKYNPSPCDTADITTADHGQTAKDTLKAAGIPPEEDENEDGGYIERDPLTNAVKGDIGEH